MLLHHLIGKRAPFLFMCGALHQFARNKFSGLHQEYASPHKHVRHSLV